MIANSMFFFVEVTVNRFAKVTFHVFYNTVQGQPAVIVRFAIGLVSATSAPAMWLHGTSLHICGTSTRCGSHMVTSNPERDV